MEAQTFFSLTTSEPSSPCHTRHGFGTCTSLVLISRMVVSGFLSIALLPFLFRVPLR